MDFFSIFLVLFMVWADFSEVSLMASLKSSFFDFALLVFLSFELELFLDSF